MTRRVVLSGASGFVAGSVIAQAGEAIELHAVSRGAPLTERPRLHWHTLPAADSTAWKLFFDSVRPDAVIHTAAVADIDFCQANPGICRQVNVEFTRKLAHLCDAHGAKLVFCSTDTVFDGEHAPYREDDPVGPMNIYAESKAEGEQVVAATAVRHVIARVGLVMGVPVLGTGNSFIAKLLASLRAGRSVTVPAHEVRTPVDVITLGRALLELAGHSFSGVLHLAGNERLSRLEINRRIATKFGFSSDLVLPGPAADIPGRAKRPRDVSLDNSRARAELETPMLDFDAALVLGVSS
jgi:dTDP-4-dehydrorhamnose reductase